MPERVNHHAAVVIGQFGPQAAAYVDSPTHAQGADLDQLESLVVGQSSARILDLGTGGGHVALRVAPHVRQVVALDLSTEMLEAVRISAERRGLVNIQTELGAVESLVFEDRAFDYVLCRYSAHHWHNFDQGIREARRVLKDGGKAAFADVASPGPALLDTFLQGIELFRDPSHVRNRSFAEWRSALSESGFVLESETRRRLRLDFQAWIKRMQTPDVEAAAIKSIQNRVSSEIASYFEIEDDGTFTVDTVTLVAGAK